MSALLPLWLFYFASTSSKLKAVRIIVIYQHEAIFFSMRGEAERSDSTFCKLSSCFFLISSKASSVPPFEIPRILKTNVYLVSAGGYVVSDFSPIEGSK